MELFKTTTLKNEYKAFTNELLPSVIECGYCNVISCSCHQKFTVTCLHCRQRHCKKCCKFNISKEILLTFASAETVDFLYNFICDFLNLSDESIKSYFPDIKIEKREKVNYKKRLKSEKKELK